MPKYVFFRQYAVRHEPAIGYGQKDAKKKLEKCYRMLMHTNIYRIFGYKPKKLVFILKRENEHI